MNSYECKMERCLDLCSSEITEKVVINLIEHGLAQRDCRSCFLGDAKTRPCIKDEWQGERAKII